MKFSFLTASAGLLLLTATTAANAQRPPNIINLTEDETEGPNQVIVRTTLPRTVVTPGFVVLAEPVADPDGGLTSDVIQYQNVFINNVLTGVADFSSDPNLIGTAGTTLPVLTLNEIGPPTPYDPNFQQPGYIGGDFGYNLFSDVPEPTALAFGGVGGLSLLGLLRYRRKRTR